MGWVWECYAFRRRKRGHRRSRSERSPLVLRIPPGIQATVRCVRRDGTAALGTLELSDGIVTHDLAQDSVARHVHDVERWNGAVKSTGALEVRLAAGVYKALFRPEDPQAGLRAFVVTVVGPGPFEYAFDLDS